MGERTETTPITPYPPSSAALSMRMALLCSIDFAIVELASLMGNWWQVQVRGNNKLYTTRSVDL